jgi:hypothetical protein
MRTHLKTRLVRLGVPLLPTAFLLVLAAPAAQAAVIVGGKGSPRVLVTRGIPFGTAGMAITAAVVAIAVLAVACVAIAGWISQGRLAGAPISFVAPGEPVQLPTILPGGEEERERKAA